MEVAHQAGCLRGQGRFEAAFSRHGSQAADSIFSASSDFVGGGHGPGASVTARLPHSGEKTPDLARVQNDADKPMETTLR